MILEVENDVVGGTFYSKFMVGELINGDDISIVMEHHDPLLD